VGKIVANTKSVLLCGGMTGTMESSARGAQDMGGLVLGIGPTMDKNDMNKHIDIPILTGMHAGRNFINVLSSDILIFVSVGSPGTLSELAFAIQLNKPIIVIRGSEKLRTYVEELKAGSAYFAESISDLEKKLKELLSVL
jgi:uncharacterized protein (TIGR00725 family)